MNNMFVKSLLYDELRRIHREKNNISATDFVKDTDIPFEQLIKENPDVVKWAEENAKMQTSAYMFDDNGRGGSNVADASSFVTLDMYEDMLEYLGKNDQNTKDAIALLKKADSMTYDELYKDNMLSDMEAGYAKLASLSLDVLKYTAFGYRFENGLAVPYYNKMAVFPLFKHIATGEMSKLYERMIGENGIDMVMFDSAVKVGSKNPQTMDSLDNITVYS